MNEKTCHGLKLWVSDGFEGVLEIEDARGQAERVGIGQIVLPEDDLQREVLRGIERLRDRGWTISEDDIGSFSYHVHCFWKSLAMFPLCVLERAMIDGASLPYLARKTRRLRSILLRPWRGKDRAPRVNRADDGPANAAVSPE